MARIRAVWQAWAHPRATLDPRLLPVIFEHTAEGVVVVGPDLRIRAMNRFGLHAAGLSEGEIVGRSCRELWPAAEGSPVEEACRRCLEQREPVTVEHRWSGEHGDRAFVIRALPAADGGLVAFCRDVSAPLRLEQERHASKTLLDQSERGLARLQHLGKIGNWELEPDTGHVTWSAGLRAQMGFGPNVPATYANFWACVHPEDARRPRDAMLEMMDGSAEGFEIEFRIRRADTGEVRWLSSHCQIERGADAHILRITGTNIDVTDQRRAELEREAVLRSIQEGFLLISPDWRITYANPAVLTMVIPGRRNMVGRDHWQAFPDTLGTPLEAHYRRAMTEGVPVVFEHYDARQRRWADIRIYPAPVGGIAVHIHDITERKQAELALAASEERFRAIVQDLGEMICRVRADGTALFVNEVLAASAGTTPAALVGTNLHALIPPEERRPLCAALAALTPQQPSALHLGRVVMPDGGTRWHEWLIRLLPGSQDEGGPVYQATGRDVTEREHAAERLRESEAKLRLALRAGGLFAWEAEPVSDDLVVGDELATLFGLPPGTVNGPLMRDRIHPDDRDRVMTEFAAVGRSGGTVRTEFRIIRGPPPDGDGAVRWIVVATEALTDPDGRLRHIGFCGDITERRQAEEARALLMREVDHRAKNVMAVVQALVQLTGADTLEAFKDAIAGRIEAMARAHSLLAQNKWDGGDLERLVRDELAAHEGRCFLTGPPVALRSDLVQPLALALHELATNAAKYGALSAPGGTIAVAWASGPGGEVNLTWTERGGPPVTPPDRAGFGSALLAQSIEGQAGGTITLDWHPAGLTCAIRLPAGACHAAPRAATGPDGPAATAAPRLDGPILIVEDQALIALELQRMLADLGATDIRRAARLGPALDLIRDRRFALVLLDADLQGQSTQPVAAELRAQGTRFAWCTGYEAVPGGDAGAPVLRKPVGVRQIARLLAGTT